MDSAASGQIFVRKKNKDDNKRGAYRKCCVVGCNNSERNNRDLHFYRFPARPYEAERKMVWLSAARRGSDVNESEVWMPTENSRICSAHFEGGEKSNDPRKTSYNPTIFHKIDGKQKTDSVKCAAVNAQHQEEPGHNILDFLEIGDNDSAVSTAHDRINR